MEKKCHNSAEAFKSKSDAMYEDTTPSEFKINPTMIKILLNTTPSSSPLNLHIRKIYAGLSTIKYLVDSCRKQVIKNIYI